jgi:4-hydroxy-tetrahydrodipicolinate synthase
MADPRGQLLPGSYTPLVTPFRDGRVDFDAFDALVELQLEGGSRGVVVCGTTGEPTSLTLGERAALYMHAAAVAEGRGPRRRHGVANPMRLLDAYTGHA